MQISYQYQEEQVALEVEQDGDHYRIRLPDGSTELIEVRRLPEDVLQVTQIDAEARSERTFRVAFAREERGIGFSYGGQAFHFAPASARRVGSGRRAGSGSLTAPMVGVVTAVLVEEGQQVEAYQPLAAIEAMKVVAMLDAPFAGTVQKLYVQPGQRVEHGAPIVDIVSVESTKDTK